MAKAKQTAMEILTGATTVGLGIVMAALIITVVNRVLVPAPEGTPFYLQLNP